MRGVLFLGRLDDHVHAAIAAARAAHPATAWTLVVTAEAAAAATELVAAQEVLPDKPIGSRWAAVRALRARRFDVAVLLWCGRPGAARLAAQGLLCGARHYAVYLPADGLRPLRAGDRRIWRSFWLGLRRGPCAPDLLLAACLWAWDRTIGRFWTRWGVRRAARCVCARLRAAGGATAAAAAAPPAAPRATTRPG